MNKQSTPMIKIARVLLLFLLLIPALTTVAQMSDKEKLTEALYLMDERRFSDALPILTELQKTEKYKDNANVNFNIGLAILNSFNRDEKVKAIPYLTKAAENASPNYTPFSPREDKAPVDAYYYLGKAQHQDYRFDEASESFKKFKTYINDKHYLWTATDREIKMTEYATQAIMNPVKIKTTNLGDKINGFYPDFSPVITIDESAIYFTSRRLRKDSSNFGRYDAIDGMYFEDIYVSYFENNEWQEPKQLNINTQGHEATVNLSIDGKTLYLYKDINGNGELYKSDFEYDSSGYEIWTKPKKLGSDINTSAYETHVTVSPDGKTLYFISDREGGYGGKDIYFCRRLPTGNWALAQNAGPILNSKYDEDGVFMHPDGETMYFSSNGHQSIGGYDFMTSTLSDTGWSKPKNLGYPINSVDDDVFLVTSPDGKRAYFSSFKEDGYGEKDIYMIQLVEADEKALTLYRGEFTFIDRNTPPSGAEVTIIDNETGLMIGTYSPRARDGQFSAILQPNKSYHFIYEADAYESYEEDIFVPANSNYQEIYKEIKLRPVRVGGALGKIIPAPVGFTNVSGNITLNGKPVDSTTVKILDKNYEYIKSSQTNDQGSFDFSKLGAAETYLLRLSSDSDQHLVDDYQVAMTNDRGETISFTRIDDSTFMFTPAMQPFEFYGIKATAIAGKVQKDGKPLANVSVTLAEEQSDVSTQVTTDEYGEFSFTQLEMDKSYRLVFGGGMPDDPEIIITNQFGDKLSFVQIGEGVYKYTPALSRPDPLAKLTDIEGNVTTKGLAIIGLKVMLLDSDQAIIASEATDSLGKFNFLDLDLNQVYYIQFEGNYPDDTKLVVANEDYDLLPFNKVNDGLYIYEPAYKVRLVDQNNGVLQESTTDRIEDFKYQTLNPDLSYTIQFDANVTDEDVIIIVDATGREYRFIKVDGGIYKYTPLPMDEFTSYTLNVNSEADFQDTYPRPEELEGVIVYFQRYFNYNAKDISRKNEQFTSFVNDIAKIIKIKGKADIIITSSASKVPTRTWKSNSILSKRRAYDTKRLLEEIFKEKGLTEDQYNFVDINTLITGPEYKGDYLENKSTYEKYQYVRIFIK